MIGNIDTLTAESHGAAELLELAELEHDEATLLSLKADVDKITTLSLPTSSSSACSRASRTRSNCFLDINAGSGGTEAQDWAQMLFRMYCRYGERKGFKSKCRMNPRGCSGTKERVHQDFRRLCVRIPAHRNRHSPPGTQESV